MLSITVKCLDYTIVFYGNLGKVVSVQNTLFESLLKSSNDAFNIWTVSNVVFSYNKI